MPKFRKDTCSRLSATGRQCNRPADHEIHDQERARRAGWKHHDFETDDPITAEQHALDNYGHRVVTEFTNKTLWIACRDCAFWDDQYYPQESR